ncbi:MAG TPA: GvpL/GvpF family gas vesicle protein [Solirubrobacteraceae bacterium]|nr:GvpL/GvpF family gas vesicle protein [Solirubrobacteraceae bacterium]
MTATALGWYVYCITAAGEVPALDGLAGVDRGCEVGCVTEGELSAVVSHVRLEEFGAEALKRNLEDLAWLKQTGLAHNAVLARALAADAVVPLRLCTIFADEDGVRDALRHGRDSLPAALTRVRGHAEWSVKLMADPRPLEAAARERGAVPIESSSRATGHAFFARKRLERVARDHVRAEIEQAVEETHARLQDHATAAVRLPPQDRRISGREGQMLLNGAYLVRRARAAEFAELATGLDAGHRETGLALNLSGPFAPYNFVGAESERE